MRRGKGEREREEKKEEKVEEEEGEEGEEKKGGKEKRRKIFRMVLWSERTPPKTHMLKS